MGGALAAELSSLSLIGNTFHRNYAVIGGAVQEVANYSTIITGNTFEYNSAVDNGGALVVHSM